MPRNTGKSALQMEHLIAWAANNAPESRALVVCATSQEAALKRRLFSSACRQRGVRIVLRFNSATLPNGSVVEFRSVCEPLVGLRPDLAECTPGAARAILSRFAHEHGWPDIFQSES